MKGRVIAELIRVWLLTAEPWVGFQLGFAVNELTLGQIFFSFPKMILIPSLNYTHLSPPLRYAISPEQTACYHILCLQVGAESRS
jgi:hypothetical protein